MTETEKTQERFFPTLAAFFEKTWVGTLAARAWNAASDYGSSNYPDIISKKNNRVFNQVLLFAIMSTVLGLVSMGGLFLYLHSTDAGYGDYLLPYALVQGGIWAACTLTYLFHAPFPRSANFLINSLMIVAIGYIDSLVIFLGTESNAHLLWLIGLIAIFFVMPRELEKVLKFVVVSTVINFIFLGWWELNFEPLYPVPQYVMEYLTPIILVFILLVLIFILWHIRKQTFRAEEELDGERKKSEELLLNILPSAIAHELKERGKSTPSRVDSASVLFTDFAGFTKIAEDFSPEEVVDELDKCFSYFDQVTDRYNLEKLKTIGDSFMCAGGLPAPNFTHAIDCCLAALEIQAFMNQVKEIKHERGLEYWELRLGINTGPLVAGVVGKRKFAYDVWGDTVNTASRMESSGVTGRVNISAATREAVAEYFLFEHRGKVAAKNKGEIDMYFLGDIRPEFSVDGAGKVPNALFKAEYSRLKTKASGPI